MSNPFYYFICMFQKMFQSLDVLLNFVYFLLLLKENIFHIFLKYIYVCFFSSFIFFYSKPQFELVVQKSETWSPHAKLYYQKISSCSWLVNHYFFNRPGIAGAVL